MDFYFYPAHTAETFNSPDLKRNGSDWATFLLGAIDHNSVSPERSLTSISARITTPCSFRTTEAHAANHLNLGLRYEYESAPFDEQDRFSRYLDLTSRFRNCRASAADAGQRSAALSESSAPIYNGAWVFADCSNRQRYHTQRFTLEPRAGSRHP